MHQSIGPFQEIREYLGRRALESPGELRSEHDHIVNRMGQGHLIYPDGPLRFSYLPILIWPQHWDEMDRLATRLYGVLRKLIALYRQNALLRKILDLHPRVNELICCRPPSRDPLPIARFDSLWVGRGYRIVEFNTDSSAGMNDLSELGACLLETATYKELATRWPLCKTELNKLALESIKNSYLSWASSSNEPPRMAIVDWSGVDSMPEFRGLKEVFERGGLQTLIVDPSELEIVGGNLTACGVPVNLVYKRALTFELLEKPDIAESLFSAYEKNLYCQIGSFEGEIVYTKLSMAALTDPRIQELLSPEDAVFIREHIPWTRRLREGFVDYHGERIDLIPYILEHRDRFVVKPSNLYAGRKVTVGFDTDSSAWEKRVLAGLDHQTVVQEVVTIPELDALFVEDGLQWKRMKFTTAQFILGGKFAGVYVRASPGPVINLNAEGATIPAFRIASTMEGARPGSHQDPR